MIRARPIFFALSCLIGLAAPAAAEMRWPTGASDWSKGMHSSVRLLDGGVDRGDRTAGLEIRLDPHFKTYWRTPGDSGLPPVFDWTGSENIRDVVVAWPAPSRFDDSAGSSIGYQGAVVLPLKVSLVDPARPALLALKLDYAVCEKICIPVKAEAHLGLPPSSLLALQAGVVRAAEKRVPTAAHLGADTVPSLRSVAVEPGGKAVIARIVVPAAAGIVDIFTEGPDGWTFAGPVAVAAVAAGAGQREITYRIGVDSRPAEGVLEGLPVSLTVTADEEAVEIAMRLEAVKKRP
jgi:DsbC/DsbD-like thiol-disulfide interchange protein